MRLPLVLDDAAVFPPGSLPLAEAVRAHRRHRGSGYAELVGPLVVPASALGELADLVGEGPLDVAVVTTLDDLANSLAPTTRGVRVVALEVSLPDGLAAEAAMGELGREISRLDDEASSPNRELHQRAGETHVYVEIPRDDRRDAVITALAGTPYRAKVRTGGVRADLYPDEAELAATITALVAAGVPFKATAGLHHAVRNTDPDTGFEQHGFLNVLAAAVPGADAEALLAERDPRRLPLPLPDDSLFLSFGTCSITEPAEELAELTVPEVTVR